MQTLSLYELANITDGQVLGAGNVFSVSSVTIDSRRVGHHALFVALQGEHYDGHDFVEHAFSNGAQAAMVSRTWFDRTRPTVAHHSWIVVDNPLRALQRLGRWWRDRYCGFLVAVTGSNGKTIVKDALVELLAPVVSCTGTVGSWNSQFGVPLALLQLPHDVQTWVCEAGVSRIGEMEPLQRILKPNFGILTNVGLAHIAGFGSREAIAREKMKLFSEISQNGWVLVPANEPLLKPILGALQCQVYTVGSQNTALPCLTEIHPGVGKLFARLCFPDGTVHVVGLPTVSRELTVDLEMAIVAAWLLGASADDIIRGIGALRMGPTRMEIWRSPQGVTLINDACSSDPISVEAALRTLNTVSTGPGRKFFIFGGMRELGERTLQEHHHIGELAAYHGVDWLILPEGGPLDETAIAFQQHANSGRVWRYTRARELTAILQNQVASNDTLLFKGPRGNDIASLASELFDAIAPNRLIVDLEAIAENIRIFRKCIGPNRQILAMIKALGYGSDMPRLSLELERMGADMLGVSTPDEGAQLRHLGCRVPILVMLATPEEVGKILRYRLTPVISGENLVETIVREAKKWGKIVNVHIKVDTGMGRMGIALNRLDAVIARLVGIPELRITGLMTHFACAEDPREDMFTHTQIERFEQARAIVHSHGLNDLISHAAATSATIRFPQAHYDMVRIGLGLYGLYPGQAVRELPLRMAVSLVTRIVDVRDMPAGARLGYGGSFVVPKGGARIGLVPMGYYDGIPWALGNRGTLHVAGQPVPIVGRVSMDSLMIDITQVPQAQRGSDVLVFGQLDGMCVRPEDVAAETGTIVYELLTRIGPRVQRIFRG